MKFACFERTLEALYKYVVPKPRSECNKTEQLMVTFTAGYIGKLVIHCYSGFRTNVKGYKYKYIKTHIMGAMVMKDCNTLYMCNFKKLARIK